MIQARVIEALVPAIEAGDDSLVEEALAHTEWVIRGAARRRYRQAWMEALRRAGDQHVGADPESVRHVLRVAALRLRGRVAADLTSHEEVLREYAAWAPAGPRKRFPVATVLAAGAALLALAALALLVIHLVSPRLLARVPRRALGPPAAGAFASGGVPLPSPRLEAALRKELPRLVAATDQQLNGGDASGRAAADRALRSPELLAELGDEAGKRWLSLLDTLAELASLGEGEAFDNASMRLLDAAGLLDDALAARGLGYYVDANVFGRPAQGFERAVWHAVIYAYQVEEVVFVRGGPHPTRVLVLRRLDDLNVTRGLLGMHAEHLRDPLVLRDPVERVVVERILPALGEGAPLPLGDDEWNGTPAGQEVALATGKAVREELAPALGPDAGRVREVGVLLRERHDIGQSWREQAGRGGAELAALDDLYLPEGWKEQLEGHVDRKSLWRAGEIEDALREADADGAMARVADVMSASVARHEAQHGRDFLRETPLPQAAILAGWVGPEVDDEAHERRGAMSAKAELSAYLAQIASDPVTPRTSLAMVCRFVFNDELAGATESYVAAAIIDRLAARLGAPLDGPAIHGGRLDLARLGKAYLVILGKPPGALREAATAVWAELFGEPLVPLI